MLIGIDLGTTNSAVAIWRDGTALLVPNALGEPQKPSPVNFKRLMGRLDPHGAGGTGAAGDRADRTDGGSGAGRHARRR